MSRKRKAVTNEWMVPSSLLGGTISSKGGKKATQKSVLQSDDLNPSEDAPLDQEERKKGNSRFYLSHVAKEQHKYSLYCTAWSTDLHLFYEKDANNSDDYYKSNITINNDSLDIEHEDSKSDTIHPTSEPVGNYISTASKKIYGNNDDASPKDSVETHSDPTSSAKIHCEHKNGLPTKDRDLKEVYCRYLATCGGNRLTIYEVPIYTVVHQGDEKSYPDPNSHHKELCSGLEVHQLYVDVDKDESFYACAFGGKSIGTAMGYAPISTNSQESIARAASISLDSEKTSFPSKGTLQKDTSASYNGPQLCCAAGKSCIIKVIDTSRRTLLLTLRGHGDDIYDLQFSPTDPWLLLSACKDESIRLWNIQTACCIATFSGHEGHRDAVIKVAWHPFGNLFASSGMDTTIKIWSLEESKLKNMIHDSYHNVKIQGLPMKPRTSRLIKTSVNNSETPTAIEVGSSLDEDKSQFRTLYEQFPIFSTNQVHSDYVDCIGFIGNLLISKSTANTITLWKPDLTQTRTLGKVGTHKSARSPSHRRRASSTPPQKQKNPQALPTGDALSTDALPKEFLPKEEKSVLRLQDYQLRSCDIWFLRFALSPDCTQVAIGNRNGEIRIFEVGGTGYMVLKYPTCTSTIRMISFSPEGDILIAICDDGTVWRWDVKD